MQQIKEFSISFSGNFIDKIEYYPSKKLLNIHVSTFDDCCSLWGQLFGQLNDRTEGRTPIIYNIDDDAPESLIMAIEGDYDQLILLLEHLETEFEIFLPKGTTQDFKDRTANISKQPHQISFFSSKTDSLEKNAIKSKDEQADTEEHPDGEKKSSDLK